MNKYDIIWNTASQWGIMQEPTEFKALMEYVDTEIKPRNFLEIGVLEGATFYCWTQLTPPDGIKIGIDLPEYGWGTSIVTLENIQERKKRVETMALGAKLLLGNSTSDTIKEMVKINLKGDLVDLLFIDGDHSYEGVKHDYTYYSRFVRKGGCIVLHDICNTKGQEGVHQFWTEIQGTKKEFVSTGAWAGIGVVRV